MYLIAEIVWVAYQKIKEGNMCRVSDEVLGLFF